MAFLWWLLECFHCYQKGIHLCSGNHSLGSGCIDNSWNGCLGLHCCSHPFHHPLQWRYPPHSILLPNFNHLNKDIPTPTQANPRSQQDLAIIPPVLCHIGFVLGGIRSAATTNPKGLLLHTWIRTQTHQRHLQCQTLCHSTGYPLSATAIMVIMRHYSHEQSIWMLFKSILLIWKDIHWRYLGGFEYVIGLPYTFNLIYF